MNGLEFLEKYPLSAEVVREWFMKKMIESVKGDNEVPEDFKNFMLEQGIDNNKISIMIDGNPRILFDVFDKHNIIIETSLYPNGEFTIKIGNHATTNSWKTRKEAEIFAIEAAFDILENQLKSESDDSNVTTDSEDN
jgi:hypothetical protein